MAKSPKGNTVKRGNTKSLVVKVRKDKNLNRARKKASDKVIKSAKLTTKKEKSELDKMKKDVLSKDKNGKPKMSDADFAKKVTELYLRNQEALRQQGKIVGGVQELPSNGKTFIVGDIHNQITNLLSVVKEAALDKNPNAKIVLVGDTMSPSKEPGVSSPKEQRGVNFNDSYRVMTWLKARYPNQVFSINGNHEMNVASAMVGHGVKSTAGLDAGMNSIMELGNMGKVDTDVVEKRGLLGAQKDGLTKGVEFSKGVRDTNFKQITETIAVTPLAATMKVGNQNVTFQHAPFAKSLDKIRALPEAKLEDIKNGDFASVKAKLDQGEYYNDYSGSGKATTVKELRKFRQDLNNASKSDVTVTGHVKAMDNVRDNMAMKSGLTEEKASSSAKYTDSKGKIIGLSVDGQTKNASVFVMEKGKGKSSGVKIKEVRMSDLRRRYKKKTGFDTGMAEFGGKLS